jgi:16S rRNA (uracil1498-N3)-methyltransferase
VTDPVFLTDRLGEPNIGDSVALGGEEGRHAAVVRRIRSGETIVVSDGLGRGVRGRVLSVDRSGLVVEVTELRRAPAAPVRYVAVQALAKGDRAELAVEMLTELGVDEVVPWQASRSVVRWSADRSDKALARWTSTAREATKQSRRLRVPSVSPVVSLSELCARVVAARLALALHEDTSEPISAIQLPASGEVMVIVGPEGGIAADELAQLRSAGAQVVSLGDGVLRTSTAGVVALAALKLR